jgi:2,5-furandicarboxylate decarboxylase 1
MSRDLRSFLAELDRRGDFHRVRRPTEARFGVTRVLSRLENEGRFPALLFEKIEGYEIPVFTNAFASLERLALAIGAEEERFVEAYVDRINSPRPPQTVPDGPVKETVLRGDVTDLSRLPLLTHHEKDAGPYITAGVAFIRDPEEGFINAGIYRMMYKGPRKLGIQFANTSHAYYILRKAEELDRPLPVAVTIGHHPAFYLGAVAMNRFGVDELSQIGGFLGEPLRMVPGSVVDLPIPADAEIVIEGEIPPHVREEEGPLGEYSGIYGPTYNEPIIEVKALNMRRGAIYQDIFVGHADNLLLGMSARLNVLFQTVKTACPTVRGVRMPLSGRCRYLCFLSIQKRTEGEAKNAALAAFAADPFLKFVVVVDDDVDIRDDSAVLHAIATRTRAGEDLFAIPAAKGSQLDPTAEDGLVTKIGIDATRRKGDYEEIRVPGVEEIRLEDYLDEDR